MSLEGSDGDAGGGEPAEQAAAADRAAEATTAPAESVEAPPQPAAPAPPESGSEPATPAPAPAQTAAVPARSNGGGPIYASPSARRLARERGVDLSAVTGSGRKGRITRDDVQSLADGKGVDEAAVPAGGGGAGGGGGGVAGLDLLPWPSVDFEKFGPIERVERSRIQLRARFGAEMPPLDPRTLDALDLGTELLEVHGRPREQVEARHAAATAAGTATAGRDRGLVDALAVGEALDVVAGDPSLAPAPGHRAEVDASLTSQPSR